MSIIDKENWKRAPFIVIEGLDGSGKTTLTARLTDKLRSEFKVICTAEPSAQTHPGRMVRQVLQGQITVSQTSLTHLFLADRADHLQNVVVPFLETGTAVICDRYIMSTLAYQATPDTFNEVLALNAASNFLQPDFTFYLSASVDLCLSRLRERGKSELFENRAKLEQAEEMYKMSIARLWNAFNITSLDASLPTSELVLQILTVIARNMANRKQGQ